MKHNNNKKKQTDLFGDDIEISVHGHNQWLHADNVKSALKQESEILVKLAGTGGQDCADSMKSIADVLVTNISERLKIN